jgi:starvation-inducible DNA-binding protein
MEELIQSTKIVLANHYAFYLKAHYYHWNITGPNFPQYHSLLENIYTEVYGVVDKIAEEIRAMDSYAPGSFSRFIQLSQIQGEETVPPAEVMLQRLLDDIAIMQSSTMRVYHLAEQEMQHNLSNFMADRQDAFNKHAWMLRATLKTA